jgi:hypothetical protein
MTNPTPAPDDGQPDLEAIEARTKLIPKIGYLVVELRGEDFPLDDGSAIQGETVAEAIVDLARADVPALIAEVRRLRAALAAQRREALTEAAEVARATNCAAINPSWSAAQEAIAAAIRAEMEREP